MIEPLDISLAGIPGRGVSCRHPRLFRHSGPRAQSHLCRFGAGADRGARRDSRLHAGSSGAELCDLWLFARVHIACGRTAGLHAGLGHARAAGGADRGDLRRRSGGGHPAHRSRAARRRTSQANSDRKYSHQRPQRGCRHCPALRRDRAAALAVAQPDEWNRDAFLGIRLLCEFWRGGDQFGCDCRRAAGLFVSHRSRRHRRHVRVVAGTTARDRLDCRHDHQRRRPCRLFCF